MKCSYLPVNTTQRDVVWSIESGSEYASVNGSTLAILPGVLNSEVTVKCTSVSNTSIVAEKTITVTYREREMIPDYAISETFYTPGPSTAIHLSDTPINLRSHIEFVDFTQVDAFDTPNIVHTVYGYLYHTDNYSYMNGYSIRNPLPSTDLHVVYFNGSSPISASIVSNKKVAFKVINNGVSYTLDGITWTPMNFSLRNDGAFGYGGYITGTVNIEFYNDVNLDISSLFNT